MSTVMLWHGEREVPRDLGPTVVTVGNFDGVHRGHQYVLARARDLADELGVPTVVAVTFDPHPMTVVMPDRAPRPLTDVGTRARLLGSAGVDAVLVLPFTAELATTAPEDFAERVLFDTLGARGVVVGENFRFGHRAAGDVALLASVGARRDARVEGLPMQGPDGSRWSSTEVRKLVAAGDVAGAAAVLGRPFALHGRVVAGARRGRELGFPTANVPVDAHGLTVPADGVYAGWVRRLDGPDPAYLPAAISVGTNPTFGDSGRRVESYILDRDDLELYGADLEVSFVRRLRGMQAFDSVDDLIRQMHDDVTAARAALAEPSAAVPPG